MCYFLIKEEALCGLRLYNFCSQYSSHEYAIVVGDYYNELFSVLLFSSFMATDSMEPVGGKASIYRWCLHLVPTSGHLLKFIAIF